MYRDNSALDEWREQDEDSPLATIGLLIMSLTAGAIIVNAIFFQGSSAQRHANLANSAMQSPVPPIGVTNAIGPGGKTVNVEQPALFVIPRHQGIRFGGQVPQTVETNSPHSAADLRLLMDIQSALKNAGVYTGNIDGLNGPQTIAAIQIFQASAGLQPNGKPDLDLLARIEMSTPVVVATPPIQNKQLNPFELQVQSVQKALNRLKMGPLDEDGKLGPVSRATLARFQNEVGLAPTGVVDDAVLRELAFRGVLD